ncbi:hypothetical protein IEQ34_008482 [Dendrobium chrysotoxum]|uniref:Uncharacterized protein n=1 Tax=Dendrobium chrysotoxum TaxID=161865 RepID=A0AAV7GZC0_DENCH|nr:hypothetical protein IEQ34_008482 [Dendrobium chrysotoxum]
MKSFWQISFQKSKRQINGQKFSQRKPYFESFMTVCSYFLGFFCFFLSSSHLPLRHPWFIAIVIACSTLCRQWVTAIIHCPSWCYSHLPPFAPIRHLVLKEMLGRELTAIELHGHTHKWQEDQQWTGVGEGSSEGSTDYSNYHTWSQAEVGNNKGDGKEGKDKLMEPFVIFEDDALLKNTNFLHNILIDVVIG